MFRTKKDLLGALMRQFSCPIGIAGTGEVDFGVHALLHHAGRGPRSNHHGPAQTCRRSEQLPSGERKSILSLNQTNTQRPSPGEFYPKISIILDILTRTISTSIRSMDEITATFEKYILENTAKDGIVIIQPGR